MIPCVEHQYTAEYIANVFWKQRLAKISSITLIPYLKNTTIYNICYIAIEHWCDSEVAYNFIQRLKDTNKETRVIHFRDDWWPVCLNKHNDGCILVGTYSTTFPESYYEKEIMTEDTHAIWDEDTFVKNCANVTLRDHQRAQTSEIC